MSVNDDIFKELNVDAKKQKEMKEDEDVVVKLQDGGWGDDLEIKID